jgi:hypothetical protein
MAKRANAMLMEGKQITTETILRPRPPWFLSAKKRQTSLSLLVARIILSSWILSVAGGHSPTKLPKPGM